MRYNSDGTLHFIGRVDAQVKLRGLRIELGEIEHHTALVGDLKHSAVILPKVGLCKDRIVALLSLRRAPLQDVNGTGMELLAPLHNDIAVKAISAVESYLASKVPSYMVPTVWIVLNELPLTSSGKIDKTRAMNWVVEMSDNTYSKVMGLDNQESSAPPSSEMEMKLQEACSNVLHLSDLHAHLNKSFQGIGGDSILAMKLMSHLRAEGITLSMKDILLSSTLSELALCMSHDTAALPQEFDSSIGLARSSITQDQLASIGLDTLEQLEDVYPCSDMQQGILLSQHKTPRAYEFQIICELLPLRAQTIDLVRLQHSWQKVVDRHAALRTVFTSNPSETGYYSQMVLKQYIADTKIVHCKDDEAVGFTVEHHSVNYEEPRPPHQLIICTTDAGKIFCSINISHALIDGMSIMLLFRDLSQAYWGEFANQSKPLYRNYISYVKGRSSDDDLTYWKSYLSDMTPQHFPTLNDGSKLPAELHEVDLDFEDYSKLQEFCSGNNVTLSSVFQVAWGLVIQAYTQAQDVSFGYLAAGRVVEVADIDEMVGVFVNMLVCRLDLSQGLTHLQLVKQSQLNFLNSLEHQHTSLAQIQHSLPSFGRSLFNTTMTVAAAPDDEDQNTPFKFEPFKEIDPTEASSPPTGNSKGKY
jgi:aryl carrier-like protein